MPNWIFIQFLLRSKETLCEHKSTKPLGKKWLGMILLWHWMLFWFYAYSDKNVAVIGALNIFLSTFIWFRLFYVIVNIFRGGFKPFMLEHNLGFFHYSLSCYLVIFDWMIRSHLIERAVSQGKGKGKGKNAWSRGKEGKEEEVFCKYIALKLDNKSPQKSK